jgi:pyrroline-5-carboxylate reductase
LTSVDMATSINNIEIPIIQNNRSTVSIGCLGCGTIASAIVTGLAKQSAIPMEKIVVTRRSERKSSMLQLQFPKLVSICDDNQQVVDQADIVFLTVLPEQTSLVLRDLQFNPQRHFLVSLVSTSTLDALSRDSQLPPSNVYKMICLPSVAYNQGVCLVQVPSVDELSNETEDTTDDSNTAALLLDLLSTLGSVVKVNTDHEMSTLMVPSGLMGGFYAVLRNNRDWLTRNAPKLSSAEATNLVLQYYSGMIQDALRAADADASIDVLDQLVAEQTPGGLNEQGIANAEGLGVFQSYNQIQDAMLKRILGESDGSV